MSSRGPKNTDSGPERRKPVLLIQHAPHEHPAVIRRALESQGIQTQWIHPYLGEAYPKLSEIRGVVSLGGPMGANDHDLHPWILPECELLKASVEAGLPTVGVCLGGQLMARALGAPVEKNRRAEVGWFPIRLNKAGEEDRILGAAGTRPLVYHWHMDTFHLPKDSILLADSRACERQAYRIGENAYGFQFHPEADHQLIQEWLDIDGTHQDILDVQADHGTRTVQDADTQRGHALQGEKASLKITTAIGQLFRRNSYNSVSCDFYDHLESWATHKTLLIVEFENSDRKITQLRGHVATLLTLMDGEFLIFKEENTLLWPIRLDHIRTLKPAK